MINKKEKEIFLPIAKSVTIVFAVYGVCSFLENLFKKSEEEDKNEIKITEVLGEIQEGSITKKSRLMIKEYSSQKN